MKKKSSLFLSIALVGGISAASAFEKSDAATVRFHEAEKFTDFRMSSMGGNSEVEYLEKQMREEIDRLAKAHLPPGHHLNVTFNDIAMAGEFEPQLGPDFDDVRIVRDVYPPRLSFSYEVIDAGGNALQSGESNLTDLNFLHTIRHRPNDTLEYEFALLSDFMRKLGNSLS